MKLIVNGKTVEQERELSIAEFLQARGLPEALVAVEHNLHWIRREDWAHIVLKGNDRLEVVRIVAGG